MKPFASKQKKAIILLEDSRLRGSTLGMCVYVFGYVSYVVVVGRFIELKVP